MTLTDIIPFRRKPDHIGEDLAMALAHIDAQEVARDLYDGAAAAADTLVRNASREIEEQTSIIEAATERLRRAEIVKATFSTATTALVEGIDPPAQDEGA